MSATNRERVLFVWLVLLTSLCAGMAWHQFAEPDAVTFNELTVQRLNVVEPDGLPRVIMFNRARQPGIFFDGVEYPHPTRDFGGLAFYNSEGDELGGLVFDANLTEDGHFAQAHLAFDQFKQDQTVTLTYRDENGKSTAGLRVDDQPGAPLLPLVKLNASIADAESDAEVQLIREQMQAYIGQYGNHAERVFIGKVPDGSSLLKLSDQRGNPRILLVVDAEGNPGLQFLDQNGEVTFQLPQLEEKQ